MTPAPDMRAGDSDRDATLGVLREAFAAGRLDADEYSGRMEIATTAKTMGELQALIEDLPGASIPAPYAPLPPVVPSASVSPTAGRVGEVVQQQHSPRWRQRLGSWLGVSVMMNVIWAAGWISDGGSAPSYWPIWVMGPWGAVLFMSWVNDRGQGDQ